MTEDEIAAALAQKREVLESMLSVMTARPADTVGISFGKRVGEGTSLAVERLSQIAAHDRLQTTLAQVVRAQEKLADGTYGTCDVCSAAVASVRLEAMPWATRCVACSAAK
jgi:DnaK suppressor protein